MRLPLLCASLFLTACPQPDTASETDPGSEVDTSTDTERDTEADTEPDTEADTERSPEMCEDSLFIESFPLRFSGADFWTDYADTGDYSQGVDCRAGSAGSSTRRIEVMGQVGKKLVVREVGPEFDAVVDVVDGCSAGDACLEGMDDPDDDLEYVFTSNEQVLVVFGAFDGFSEGAAYDFTVDIVDVEDCSDVTDDDGDGFVSCLDDDCLGSPACEDFCPSEPAVLEQVHQATEADFNVGWWGGQSSAVVRHVSAEQGQLIHAETSSDMTWITIHSSCDVYSSLALASGAYTADYVATEAGDYYITIFNAVRSDHDFSYKFNVEDVDLCADAFASPEISGADWSASGLRDVIGHDGTDGCAYSEPGSLDYAVPLYAEAGETIRVTQLADLDITVNITRGTDSCTPDADGATCVAGQDDPDGITYEVTADDVYVVVISNYFADLSNRPTAYDIAIDVLPAETCSNGTDDDEDGLVDCLDPDCAEAAECAVVECPEPMSQSSLPMNVSGADFNSDFADVFNYTEVDECERGLGPDAVWTVQALAGDTIVVTELGTMDAVVNITRGPDACAPTQNDNTCVFGHDDGPSFNDGVERRFDVTEDGIYHVIVTSYDSPASPSDYDITIDVEQPGLCDDLEVLTPGITFLNGYWSDLDDVLYLPSVGGCEGGSASNNSSHSGNDLIVPVMLQDGQRITIIDIYDQSQDLDFIVNIFRSTCEEAVDNPSCVYSDDDPSGTSSEVYAYEAPPLTVSLLYYVVISTYHPNYGGAPGNPDGEYAFQIVVGEP